MFTKTLLPIALFVVLEVFLNYTGLDEISDLIEFIQSSKHIGNDKISLLCNSVKLETQTLNYHL